MLAADEAVQQYDTSGREAPGEPVCKIRRVGRWWYLLGGYQGETNDSDVFTRFDRALVSARTLVDAVTAARAEAAAVRRHVAKLPPPMFYFAENGPVLGLAIAGVEAGVPVLGLVTLDVVTRAPRTFREGAILCPRGTSALWGAGVPGPLIEYTTGRLAAPPWLQRRDAAAARRLVSLQIAAAPHKARPPTGIGYARVTAGGSTISLRKPQDANWTLTTGDNTSLVGQIAFEVQ